jgi:hypothetical protein
MKLNINFSSRSTSLDVQRNLESILEKRTKDTYGPPIGKKLVCFIDDLNMPQVSLNLRSVSKYFMSVYFRFPMSKIETQLGSYLSNGKSLYT